jgi:NAD(P)-dependent dehydrogenase (short-subunit alcohol dehydrogenase family)
MDQWDQLKERVALVTGGGRGLGQAICRMLASNGSHVVVADIKGSLAESTACDLTGEGGRAEALEVDVADEDQARRAVETTVEHWGRIDILVNNAGIDVTLPADELDVGDWDRIIAVNLRAPFLLSRAAIPHMKRQGGGSIVNIASTASLRAWPNASPYHASKWGLLGLSRALHAELRPSGIKVTAVVTGGMRTSFLLDRFPEIDPAVLQDPANVAETVRFVLCQPDECVVPEVMVLPMRETSWP